jgi:hypothetical protein
MTVSGTGDDVLMRLSNVQDWRVSVISGDDSGLGLCRAMTGIDKS